MSGIIDLNGKRLMSEAAVDAEEQQYQRGIAVERTRVLHLTKKMKDHYTGLKTLAADKQTRDDAAVMEATMSQLIDKIAGPADRTNRWPATTGESK